MLKRQLFYKTGALKKFTGKHLSWSLFFNKFTGWRHILLQMGLLQKCFPVNFTTFLRTFFVEHLRVTASLRPWYHFRVIA